VDYEQSLTLRQLGGTFGNKRTGGVNSMIAAITFTIPLFNLNGGGIKRAASEQLSVDHELAWAERTIATDVRGAHAAATRLTRQLGDLQQTFLTRAESVHQLTLAAYQEGGATLLQVLDATRMLADARLAYSRTLFAQRQSLFDLALTTAGTWRGTRFASLVERRVFASQPCGRPAMKRSIVSLIPLVVLPAAVTCGGAPPIGETAATLAAERQQVAMTREEVAHAGVRWGPVQAATMADAVEVPGELAPNEDSTARLGAPARARVQTVHVHMGERVARGQALVTLVSEEASSAQAEHAKAVANLSARRVAAKYARLALERSERLLELKAIARQDVERARVDHEEAESMHTQAEAEVERASATLSQLGVSGGAGEIVVRAPLAGVVLTRDAVPGSVVNAGDSLLMITDPGTLWLDIAATQRVATTLRPGSRVTFTVPELAPRTFDAVIETVSAALDPATRTLPLHAWSPRRSAPGHVRDGHCRSARRAGVIRDAAMQLLDECPSSSPRLTAARARFETRRRGGPTRRPGAHPAWCAPGDVIDRGCVRGEIGLRVQDAGWLDPRSPS
jgi:cobalt-zinc-cadmium efflux system membrane fusion protein